jgi:hypothetical protein
MFKKLIITGAAAALMLSAAAGAFASEGHHFTDPGSSITISNNATVNNVVNTSANTGYNTLTVTGGLSNSGITTGAANAGVSLTNQVNFNQFSCGCLLGSGNDPFTLKITNGDTSVGNVVNTSANTGYNVLSVTGGSNGHDYSWFGGEGGSKGGSSGLWITTGAAAASSVVSNVVNTNVFGTTTP